MKHIGLVAAAVVITTMSAPAAFAANKKFDAKATYATSCAGCHGAAGAGGFGPSLTKVEAKGDAFIVKRILEGAAPKMPGFKATINPDEAKALAAYVKSL